MQRKLDCDGVAGNYTRRYANSLQTGTSQALLNLIKENGLNTVLEAGCGTGHWLRTLQPATTQVVGLDFSQGMFDQARLFDETAQLVRGRAEQLPFQSNLQVLV